MTVTRTPLHHDEATRPGPDDLSVGQPTEPVLEAQSVAAGYGRNRRVVHDLSLAVAARQVCAVLGANGAGKSTLLGALAGLLPLQAGAVHLHGENVGRLAVAARVQRGLVLVPQGRQLFNEMSVRENLLMGGFRRRSADLEQRIEESVESFPVLQQRLAQAAGSLSGGEQQMLAVARGLVSRPSVMLLDEPSLGIAPQIRREMFDSIAAICRERGLAVVIAEQDVRLAVEAADVVHVMQFGQIAFSAPADPELLDDDRLRRAYLGR